MEITNEMISKMIGDDMVNPDPCENPAYARWRNYLLDCNEARRVIAWALRQDDVFLTRFHNIFSKTVLKNCDLDKGILTCLLATPKQICETAVRARKCDGNH